MRSTRCGAGAAPRQRPTRAAPRPAKPRRAAGPPDRAPDRPGSHLVGRLRPQLIHLSLVNILRHLILRQRPALLPSIPAAAAGAFAACGAKFWVVVRSGLAEFVGGVVTAWEMRWLTGLGQAASGRGAGDRRYRGGAEGSRGPLFG
jgi:hypothetical protein